MPKVIEDLRETILCNSKAMLLGQGYEKLTIRSVAATCHVAVGTIYNYFPSKDVLVASVMLEDWFRALAQMRQRSKSAETALDGLREMYDAISEFSGVYAPAWEESQRGGGSMPLFHERHQQLLEQLDAVTMRVLSDFAIENPQWYSRFITEAILRQASCGKKEAFAELVPVLKKILA